MHTQLTEDIAQTLSKAGLTPEVIAAPIPHIICPNAQNSVPKAILPMNLQAITIEEAITDALIHSKSMKALSKHYRERPIAIPEDRWRSQTAMMKARLLAHMEIFTPLYARNCEIRRIGKHEASEFLAAHHSYGDASCRYRYGIFLKRHTGHIAGQDDSTGGVCPCKAIVPGTLVAAAEFSNARKWDKDGKTIRSYEWVRYASAAGTRICGGMGKVLKAFIDDVAPDDIMSYADMEWSEGSVYEHLGFVPEGEKEALLFKIDPHTYIRTPIKPDDVEDSCAPCFYFKNSGSRKYRLKITEYR